MLFTFWSISRQACFWRQCKLCQRHVCVHMCCSTHNHTAYSGVDRLLVGIPLEYVSLSNIYIMHNSLQRISWMWNIYSVLQFGMVTVYSICTYVNSVLQYILCTRYQGCGIGTHRGHHGGTREIFEDIGS